MKFTIACVFTLVVLSINEASSVPFEQRGGVTCKHKHKTNGLQVKGGSCSTTIQGEIPSVNHMISTLITKPSDHKVLSANKPFKIEILVDNLETGHFSDPDKDYYVQPQELGSGGIIKGHSHITVQEISTDKPPNPQEFVFFKGLEEKADDGRLSVDVVQKDGTPGLAPGKYRICTMTSTFSHQPVLMPVAKRGSQDDCIRIEVERECDKCDDKKDKAEKVKEVGKPKDHGKPKDPVGKAKDPVGKAKDPVGKEDHGKAKDKVGKTKDKVGNEKE